MEESKGSASSISSNSNLSHNINSSSIKIFSPANTGGQKRKQSMANMATLITIMNKAIASNDISKVRSRAIIPKIPKKDTLRRTKVMTENELSENDLRGGFNKKREKGNKKIIDALLTDSEPVTPKNVVKIKVI